jgi:hypothetical protein
MAALDLGVRNPPLEMRFACNNPMFRLEHHARVVLRGLLLTVLVIEVIWLF